MNNNINLLVSFLENLILPIKLIMENNDFDFNFSEQISQAYYFK